MRPYIFGLVLLGWSCAAARAEGRAPDVRGDFGGPLALLRAHMTRPEAAGECNWLFDLWSGQALSTLARASGLTNNHALIIDSHGEARRAASGREFAFLPHRELLRQAPASTAFSIRDFSRILGPARGQIHNVVLSACNRDGALDTAAIRRYFPAVTNIVHLPAGELGFQPMFYRALTHRSATIATAFGRRVSSDAPGEFFQIEEVPSPQSRMIQPYVAELFLPGSARPFRVVRAGREILEPGVRESDSL